MHLSKFGRNGVFLFEDLFRSDEAGSTLVKLMIQFRVAAPVLFLGAWTPSLPLESLWP